MLVGCGSQAPIDPITFDPCASISVASAGASSDQLASIDAAFAMWRDVGLPAFGRGATPDIAIVFHDAADSIYGFYDDTTATIYVNTRLVDPAQRAITIAHELGHSLGLVHIAPATRASVMNPGNVTLTPNAGDRATLATLWGSCSGAP